MATYTNVTSNLIGTFDYPEYSLLRPSSRRAYGTSENISKPLSFDRCRVQVSRREETQSKRAGVQGGVREGPGKHAHTATVRDKPGKIMTQEAYRVMFVIGE